MNGVTNFLKSEEFVTGFITGMLSNILCMVIAWMLLKGNMS